MRHLILLTALAAQAAEFPEAVITNGAITAKLYLPDPARGYYRGTRFDWSGQISSLKTAKHEYFGQWFPKYDPEIHDSIMGPVEEFRTGNAGLGFDEAPAGGSFVRIGVGVVRPDDKPYEMAKTLDILDHGKWRVRKGRDHVTFTHELTGPNGYAYRYTKTIRLAKGAPVMLIEHALRNTGRKIIQTSQYNHNFFVMDGQPTGPATVTRVPFDIKPVRPFTDDLAKVSGREFTYTAELQTGQRIFGEFNGFGPTAADYDFRLENRKAGAGVHITGDVPIARLMYWSIRTVFSPEAYIDLTIPPGAEKRWKYTYEFYDLPAAR